MAGNDDSDKPLFRLKLLVDKEKNKVVLAEAGKDFVDLLFTFLTMPMGSIVRVLKKYQQNQNSQAPAIGCFNNLYKSVLDMSTDNFLTEASKHMLLYPRSVSDRQFNHLGLGDEPLKYYRCPKSGYNSSCLRAYSNFCSSRCSCGAVMDKEFKVYLDAKNCHGDMLVSGNTFLIITDDLKLVTSMSLTLKTLRELGYTDVDELEEMLVNANFNEVFALLEFLFSSDTPLTDVFLREVGDLDLDILEDLGALKEEHISTMLEYIISGSSRFLEDVIPERISSGITKMISMPSLLSVNVFTRKQDKKVLYVECGEDFVDLLFTFLAIPLKSVWETSGSNAKKKCIGNLYDSYKSLSFNKETAASSSRCMLPWYYSCQRQLLNVCYEVCGPAYKLTKDSLSYVLKPRDPRCNGSSDSTTHCDGFVKRRTMFMVSDDLIITPMNSSEAISLLKKMNTDLNNIEEQVINITMTEATSLLRASLMTSTAMTTALSSLLVSNKRKEEKSKPPMSLLGRLILNWCNFRFL